MGGDRHNSDARFVRASASGYFSKPAEEVFAQKKARKIHESMDPKGIRFRESRDSFVHPYSYPIIFVMDVTGSMQEVPHHFIKDGLPKMVSGIIEHGVESPALLFVAVGDSQAGDKAPLQVGQFESGDLQMDTWLERVWPEGGGGGNAGESYLWAWYFAAYHTATDAWDKREEKGLLITFGDEPCLKTITATEYHEVMGNTGILELEFPLKAEQLLKKAQEKWNVIHLHLTDHRPTPYHWKEWLGQQLIEIPNYTEIPNIVAKLAKDYCSYCGKPQPAAKTESEWVAPDEEDEVL